MKKKEQYERRDVKVVSYFVGSVFTRIKTRFEKNSDIRVFTIMVLIRNFRLEIFTLKSLIGWIDFR